MFSGKKWYILTVLLQDSHQQYTDDIKDEVCKNANAFGKYVCSKWQLRTYQTLSW
jgi:hypothetical protein